jgi:hypothetical protein
MAGFWRRQFDLPASPQQQLFDLLLGVVAPVLCLLLDPAIFRPFAGGTGFMRHYRLFAYLEIGLSILMLLYYMATKRASAFLTGVLFGSAIFALSLGAVILPVTLLGLLVFIGVFGLTPFFTFFVFLRNSHRCWQQYRARTSRMPSLAALVLGVIVIFGLPAGVQASIFHYGNRALAVVQSGPEEDFAGAVHTLKWLHYDTDEIAFIFQRTNDPKQRERLSRAFTAITGETVQDRLAQLND